MRRPRLPCEDTIRRAQHGDDGALEELYRWLYPIIRRYAYTGTENVTVSEDIACETLLRVVENLPRCDFSGERSVVRLKSWAFRTARNLMIDEHRRGTREREHAQSVDVQDSVAPPEIIQRSLDRDHVHRSLERLTSLQRKVIVLKFLKDQDNATVGRLVGRSVAAVKSLQHRALLRLRGEILATGDGWSWMADRLTVQTVAAEEAAASSPSATSM